MTPLYSDKNLDNYTNMSEEKSIMSGKSQEIKTTVSGFTHFLSNNYYSINVL